MARTNLRGLLTAFLFLFFAASIAPVHSYPTTLSNTTQALSKRTPNPKIPTAEEAAKHLKKLGPGKQVFYRDTTHEAPSHYARKIGGGLLANADDGDGWANLEGGPFRERALRVIDNKPTWSEIEVDKAVQAVSNGYALNAEGDVVVVLPYNIPNTFSFWDGEFEVLKKNENVDKILAFDMNNPTVEPKGSPRELWPKEQPKTEHAG
ncbi:uncharacterized protein N7482_003183 [Penicillium canariense]|uniref:Uncharacterized protein n=1 Tax=Penicillium canariense TaxID=189055 RepID=A0A9W9LN57_9EURO|nr:uncharacterized protein N7482_003183 [Penicillium canariense]KAJ5167589.1 hypothetical protein N7482_003183 [Penicillium canariense]